MKPKYIAAGCTLMGLLVAPALSAQDIYRVTDMANEDLNGTARFVGMGGALSALGADMSVMSTNPAGIGLFRSSDVSVTAGLRRQIEGNAFAGRDVVNLSFDQAGFVYSIRTGGKNVRFFNMGFNYHKRKNFNDLFGGGVNLASLNGISQSWQMADLAYTSRPLDLSIGEDNTMSPDFDLTTPLTGLGAMTQMIIPEYDEEGNLTGHIPCNATSNQSNVARWGGVEEYDFNFSGNIKDRFYVGMTLSAYHVDWHNVTGYSEVISDGTQSGDYQLSSEESLTGNGFDLKFGFIMRPVEESAFRIGLSFTTPTFFDLTHSAYANMTSPFSDSEGYSLNQDVEVYPHDYRIRTPWKLNVSLGHTIGSSIALGAEYEFADYSSAKISYPDYGYNDYWDYSWSSGSDDQALNAETKYFLKKVHTFRVGAEAKVYPGLFLRAGYNYVSSPMRNDAYNNLFTESPSYYYSVSTDYLNLKETNRVTAGIGYRGKHFYADMAYQYEARKGDYYAFHVPYTGSEENALTAVPVKLNKHQLLLTLGYKF